MNQRLVFVLIVAVLSLCAGCAATVRRAYDGSPRPAAEIGVVLIAPPVQLKAINGVRIEQNKSGIVKKYSERIELLPGTHTITVGYGDIGPNAVGGISTTTSGEVLLTVQVTAGECQVIMDSRPGDNFFQPVSQSIDCPN